MASRVTVFHVPGHPRSEIIANAMLAGIRRVGDQASLQAAHNFTAPDSDVAVFYGFERRIQHVFAAYRALGLDAVHVDLGYWGRKEGGQFAGFHKVCVNDRHATAYFQRSPHDGSRISRFGLTLQRQRHGRAILLAGMSAKSAETEGFAPEEWERLAVELVRASSDRPIIYRPKPSWRGARPIEGTYYGAGAADVRELFDDCFAVVTHHSNVAVEAVVAGLPVFCVGGLATPLSISSFDEIETAGLPDGRQQWLNDVGWSQWSVAEMQDGLPWKHLKDEGLLP